VWRCDNLVGGFCCSVCQYDGGMWWFNRDVVAQWRDMVAQSRMQWLSGMIKRSGTVDKVADWEIL
jgi:hypothetical protein